MGSTKKEEKTLTIQTPETEGEDSLSRNKDMFYNLSADSEFCLSDGGIIKVNRGMLCCKTNSNVFFQMLFGPLKDEVTVIPDIDSLTFRLFIDCVMDFEAYTHDVAFKIFPVAWKYQVKNCISKCIDTLEFNKMDEKICEALNMASFYDCPELVTKILDFIFEKYGPLKFIEKSDCFLLLDPSSVMAFLKRLSYFDSHLLDILVQWGKHYSRNNDDHLSVRDLFDKFGITLFIKENDFETVSALIEYCFSDLGKNVFLVDEVTNFSKNSKNLNLVKSRWRHIKKGECLTEEISLDLLRVYTGNCAYIDIQIQFLFNLKTNILALYDLPVQKCNLDIELSYLNETRNGKTDLVSNCYEEEQNKITPCIVNSAEVDFHLFFIKDSSSVLPLNIKYKFHSDCRILLTTESNSDKMCFTRDISCISMQIE